MLGLLVGCDGGASEPPASDPATSTPATGDESASAAPSASGVSPSASSSAPAGGEEVTAADGALTWTMPCADPADQDIEGNEEDKKTYKSFLGWRCGEQGSATSGALVLEPVKAPANADAARKAMRTGLAEFARAVDAPLRALSAGGSYGESGRRSDFGQAGVWLACMGRTCCETGG